MNPTDSSATSRPVPPAESHLAAPTAAENGVVNATPAVHSSSDLRSPLARYWLRTSDLIAVALLAIMLVLLSIVPLWHTDVWAHVKFGQWMVEHGRLPDHEPFSPYADPGPYINFQWLTQGGLYLLYQLGARLAGGDELYRLAGGAAVLRTAFLLVIWLRYVLLLLAYRRRSGSMVLACAGLVLAFLFPAITKAQRPQQIGELFFAALLLVLSRPLLSRRALLLVPLGCVLWANMHGSYLMGLALLGVFFLGRLVEAAGAQGTWRWRAAAQDPQARRLLLVGLLSAAAIAVLNPHGPRLYWYTLQLAKHPNIPMLVEWQPLDFHWGIGGHWAYLFLLLLLLASQALSPRSLSPTGLLLVASFGVLPLAQQRMLTWWVLLVPWLLLPLWAAIGRKVVSGQSADKPDALAREPTPPLASASGLSGFGNGVAAEGSGRKTLLAGFLLFMALLWTPPVQWLRARGPQSLERQLAPGTPWRLAAQLTADPDDKTKPFPELAAALRSSYPHGRFHGVIFASESQGDYLLWALPADYPVMLYTHVHLFSPRHWQECWTVKTGAGGWWEILDRHGVNLVIVEPERHPNLAQALRDDPAWQIVLDETGLSSKPDPMTRQLIALRKHPRTRLAATRSGARD